MPIASEIRHAEHVHVEWVHHTHSVRPPGMTHSPGEPGPRLNHPTPLTPPICVLRPASAACCAIVLLPSSLPPNQPEVVESAGLCVTYISDVIVDGCGAAVGVVVHVALGGPTGTPRGHRGAERCPRCTGRSIWRLRGRLFVRGSWHCCCCSPLTTTVLEHRQGRRVHHAHPAVAHGWG